MAEKSKKEAQFFEHETLQDTESVVRFFEAIGQAFREGSLLLQSGEQQMEVVPDGLVKFTLKSSRKGRSVRLSLKMRWEEPPDTVPLYVGSSKPQESDDGT